VLDTSEIDRENIIWRIDEYGPGAELVRQCEVDRLQELMKPFYSHGSVIDIFVLRNALELGERLTDSRSSATLVECFLAVLGIDARSVVSQLHTLELSGMRRSR
jgi:hypothetical protein